MRNSLILTGASIALGFLIGIAFMSKANNLKPCCEIL